jgi:outer membrane receptor protein involved in Fe transport
VTAKTSTERDRNPQPRRNAVSQAVKIHSQSRRNQYLAAAVVSGALAMPQQAPAQDLMIEEIIVTAQKRAESLQDVPISVTAFDSTKLDQLGIDNFEDYIAMMPSVSYTSVGPATATIYMRGASDGGDGNASGSQPSVGLYLDEAPVTAIAANVDVHVYDIERIEALAGPQGTLYGASNQSGTLRIITKKPDTEEFSAGFDVGGASTTGGAGSYSVEGFVNFPLSDNAAIRLVGWNIEDGGWIDNVAGTRTFQLEGAFGYNPNNFGRTNTIDNASQVEEDFNELTKSGLRAALRVDLNENWVGTVGVLYQSLDTEGTWDHDPKLNPRSGVVPDPWVSPTGDRNIGVHTPAGEHNIQRFFADFSDEDFIQGSWTLEGEFGNNSLIYAGAYMDRDVEYQADYSSYAEYRYFVPYYACDYSATGPDLATESATDCTGLEEFYTEDNNYERQTHELRLQSLGEGRLHYTVGGYFTEITHTYLQQWHQPNMSPTLMIAGTSDVFFRTDQERTDQQTALFGEVTYDINDSFSLTGGLRYFWNDTDLVGVVGWGPSVFDPTNSSARDTPVNQTRSDNDYILKGNATWRVSDDAMVYFTYSEGYRPGGINRDPGLVATAGTQLWIPDTVTNYELGWKTTGMDGRLRFNGAVFFADWDDIQYTIYEFGLSACCGNVYNLSTAEMKGVEVDATVLISDGWSISAAMTYTDAETTADFVLPSGTLSVLAGTELPNVPEFKGNVSTRFEFGLGNLNAYGQITYQHVGSSFNQIVAGDPTDLTFWNDRQEQDSYQNLNIRAGIDQESWGVDLYVNNATDEVAELYIQPRPYEQSITTNRPLTVGAKFWMRF